jgi:hypothetical protein
MENNVYVPKIKNNSLAGESKEKASKEKYIIWIVEGGLGKNIAATALCQTIKEKHPDRKLILVVSYPEVFLNNPYADRVYFSGSKPYFYEDYIKDKDSIIYKHEPYHQTGHILRKKHLIENWSELIDVQYNKQQPQIFVNMAQQLTVRQWIRNRPTMVLQTNGGPLTGQKYPYSWCRDIPFEIASEIYKKYKDQYHIFQITRPDCEKIAGAEIIDQPMNNMELFAILISSQKRVLIDSCLQHAAASFKLPSTVLWIGTCPTVFGYDLHTNIVADKPRIAPKQIDGFIFDYNLDGVLHECPYMDYKEIFSEEKINSI